MSWAQKIIKGFKHFLLSKNFLESKNVLESKSLWAEIFYGAKRNTFGVKFFCGETFLGPTILGSEMFALKLFWESTQIVQQLLFLLCPSILAFDFDLILEFFLTLWGPNWLFLSPAWGSKTVLGSTHVVEQLSFSIIS